MVDSKNIVKRAFSKHFAAGHFTHACALAATLGDREARFRCELGEDGKSRFDLASLTKALVISTLVYRDLFTQRCSSSLDGVTLDEFFQGLDVVFSKEICSLRLQDVLSHRSGLPDWLSFWTQSHEESCGSLLSRRDHVMTRLNHLKLVKSQKLYQYSDVGFILLGLCLEVSHKRSLSEVFRSLVTGELGLTRSRLNFNTDACDISASISTGYSAVRRIELQGLVHDENSAFLNGVAGHAGLFGTAEEIWLFLEAMLATAWGQNLVEENAKLRAPGGKQMWGLSGWHQGAGESSRTFASGRSMGHLGFTGTAFWFDPETSRLALLLTNRVISERHSPWMTGFRAEVFGALDVL